MEALFEKNVSFDDDVKRNIVSLKVSEDLFDDLYNGEPNCKAIAMAVEARVKQDAPNGVISRGFHYTTGIMYPFESENYQRTRFSDGSFGCWYGSLDLETTIYETAFHNMKDILGTAGISEIIYREGAIYNIHCKGILLDFRGQETKCPQLVKEDYAFTQQIGRRLSNEGHPGLLTSSARKPGGVNIVAFSEKILSKARVSSYLSYYINPLTKTVKVEKEKGSPYLEIDLSQMINLSQLRYPLKGRVAQMKAENEHSEYFSDVDVSNE